MRQHKYRAWNKIDKVMISLPNSPRMVNGELVCDDDDILLEYIGLADKSGVDIFEGDAFTTDDFTSDFICVVTWSNDDCAFILKSGGQSSKIDPNYLKSFKLIGNIHENPELIE